MKEKLAAGLAAVMLSAAACHRAVDPAAASATDEEPSGDVEGEETPPSTPAFARSEGDGAALHAEALRELSLARTTHYEHHTSVDEAAGVFDYDCSGFVDYALARVAPSSFEALRAVMTKRRPQAVTFVTLLSAMSPGESRGGWMRVARASDLVPGDVLAWRALPGAKNTGHVMIVDGPASARGGDDGADEWLVPVIDSTAGGHGGEDPRKRGGSTGLGRGTVVLLGAEPRGFRWTAAKTSKRVETEVVLGRLAGRVM